MRFRFTLWPTSFAMIAAMTLCAASAQQSEADQTEADRLRQIELQRQENARRLEEIRNRAAAAAADLASLRVRAVETAESLRQAEERAADVASKLEALQAEEEVAMANLVARQDALSGVLAALLSLERSRPPALAVSPDDATEAAQAAIMLSSVTPELREEAAELRAAVDRVEALRRERASERAQLSLAESALEERRRLLDAQLSEREAARRRDAGLLSELEAEDRRLAREATTLRELIRGIEARGEDALPVVDRLAVAATRYDDLPDRFSQARAKLALPAAGRILSGYGSQARARDPQRGDGITLETRPSAVVTTPFKGRVDWAEPFGRLGNVAIIDVGEGYRMVLYGLNSLSIRRGDEVGAGEPIGVMAPQGPGILTFQIRRRDLPIDPEPFLLLPLLEQVP